MGYQWINILLSYAEQNHPKYSLFVFKIRMIQEARLVYSHYILNSLWLSAIHIIPLIHEIANNYVQ